MNNVFKKIILLGLIVVFSMGTILYSAADVDARVKVKGYYRKDGTYVNAHYRSNPDGNPYNNWSFPGNYNPNTGEISAGNPDTYLKNYYDNDSSSNHSYTSPSYAPIFTASISNGDLVKTILNDTIYFIQKGTKRAVPSPEIFNASGWRWSDVRTVLASELEQVPWGDNVLHPSAKHFTPPVQDHRIFRVPGSFDVWELSYWQQGLGTRKKFYDPQSFEERYSKNGWGYIKPISYSELLKYDVLGIYY